MRFSLDGRVLTVQLLPDRPEVLETVSGAEISATCGTNVAAPPGDPRGETTVSRIWPAGETSLSYRFPRDVSSWCLLGRQSVDPIVASVNFPLAWSGAKEQIAETANGWARQFASSAQACNDYYTGTGPTACEPERRPSEKRGSGQRSTAARRSRKSPLAVTERPPRFRTMAASSGRPCCDVPRRASG